jgi:hypothetical protein
MSKTGATPEQLNNLARPIPKSLVKTGKKQQATFSYITARTVMNWLDFAVGRENWRTEYRVIIPASPLTVECTLFIRIDGEWVGKADVGTEENFSPQKAAYSNALKRAGAQWGIGRELYGEGNVYEEDIATFDPATGEVVAPPATVPTPTGQEPDSTPAPQSDDSGEQDAQGEVVDPPANDAPESEAQQDGVDAIDWRKFWPWTKNALELDRDGVHAALEVESVKDWQGSKSEAADKLRMTAAHNLLDELGAQGIFMSQVEAVLNMPIAHWLKADLTHTIGQARELILAAHVEEPEF